MKRRHHSPAAKTKPKKPTATPPAAPPQPPPVVEQDDIPRSMVVRRGRLGKYARELVTDMRTVMAPHTAMKLKERNTNSIKDFVNVAPVLGVTHVITISQAKKNESSSRQLPSLSIGRLPHGPTVTFTVNEYSLASKLRKVLTKKSSLAGSGFIKTAFAKPPLVVLNNFELPGNPKYVSLVGQYFHSMFPGLDVSSVKLAECRRVLLVNFIRETEKFELRQYYIKAEPQGVTRPLRKIVKAGAHMPDLSRVTDVAEVVERGAGLNAGDTSDSEADDPNATVVLPVDLGHRSRGNHKGSVSVVKLKELGPRLSLTCRKVQEDLFDGEVTYHAHRTLTEAELVAQRVKVEENKSKVEERRKIQQENVERKRLAEEEKTERKRVKAEQRKTKLDEVAKRFKDDDDEAKEEDTTSVVVSRKKPRRQRTGVVSNND